MTAPSDLFTSAVQFHQAGQLAQAEALCRQVLESDPGHADALNLLGVLAHQTGRNDTAIDYLRRAIAVNPADATFHYNLGVAYQMLGRATDAIAAYREAVRLRPTHADAHHNLGIAYQAERKMNDAVTAFRWAVELEPNRANYRSDLANLLTTLGRAQEALPHYQQAIRLQPSEPAHHSNLGNVLILLGRPEEAEASCRESLRLKPDQANALHNLAIARSCQGQLDEAIATNAQALRLNPDHAGAHNCHALWSLQKGDFERGWQEYTWRWKIANVTPRDFRAPVWDGSPLSGRTILLHAEQGLGDTIQFIRYASLVKERGGRVVVECQPALVRLLGRCAGIDQLVPRGSPLPAFDVHCPLLDLPRLYQTTLATVPFNVPYVFADPQLVETWGRELGGGAALKIGIGWQGNPQFPGDTLRSMPLRHFAALGRREGVRLFSLQKGAGREQLAPVLNIHITDLGGRLDEAAGPFMDTAAVMMNLDLVVTSDTAIAHLAGALGVPVWVALAVGADWRFLVEREDSPWYPTMRLFRQKRPHEWDEALERIAAALPVRAATLSPATVARTWGATLDHYQSGHRAEAEQGARQVVAAEPCHAEALNLLGVLAHQAAQNDVAAERLRQAIHLAPDNAGFHYNLGVALQVLGRRDEAAASYRETLRLQPNHADAHHNLGFIRAQQDEPAEAESHYRSAVQFNPDHPRAHTALGFLLWRQNQFAEAVTHLRQAARLHPDDPDAHHNLGWALVGLGEYEEGRAQYDQALRLQPDYAEARFCKAMLLLLQGDFLQGFAEYEWRWQSKLAPARRHNHPVWDGSPLAGRTILLHAEQGFGDTIQFIRYAPLVKARGGAVVVECWPQLLPLLRGCAGIDHLIAQGSPLPPCDVRAPLLSLPRIFGTTLTTIPETVPYLTPDPEAVQRWREELSNCRGFKVGIAWQGSPTQARDASRSLPLRDFAALARIPGVRLYSLQKGAGTEQLREIAAEFSVTDFGDRLDAASGPFVDTAALMTVLDLVIVSDSSLAHLAGALGVPVWVALPFAPDWRWLLEREDCPWYPTMRLFRQTRLGDWNGVFERIAAELQRRLGIATGSAAGALATALDHFRAGRPQQAEQTCREALAVEPNHADTLNLLGVLAHQAGRSEEAVKWLRRAIAVCPTNAVFHYNLGVAQHVLGRLEEAAASYEQALRRQSDHADAHNNRGLVLTELNRPDEALVHYAEAVRIEPGFVEARSNWGLALAALGHLAEALGRIDQALAIDPDNADAHLARAVIWLLQGDFERGWAEYEWRWRCQPAPARGVGSRRATVTLPSYPQPLWDGSSLSGRTILLHAEQGFGDTMQFIRYARLVKQRGGTVIFECPRRLARLLKSCPGIDVLVESGAPLPPFDVHAPLLSLPRLLGTTLATIPADVPYLFADAALIESWTRVLGSNQIFKVGIAWQCDPRYNMAARRAPPLRQFAPLARLPGIQLYSLQKGAGTEQLRDVAGQFAVTDFGERLDEESGPFMDTAALMRNLDLVIVVDTSLAHLAGALGVPVWVALPFAPCWRWLLGREDSPWYPTMRLFRQTQPGDWDGVFVRMAQELERAAGLIPAARRATVCILTYGDYRLYFERCLESVLATTPHDAIELRLGFNAAPDSLAYARQRLGLDEHNTDCRVLPGDIQRCSFVTPAGMPVHLWNAPINLYKEPMARLMYHDRPLSTEYAIWFDDDSFVEVGWWEALLPLLEQRVDSIGQRWWVDYLPGQSDMIQAQPWYRGVPFEEREGRRGVEFMTGGFLAIRSERLRQADFPPIHILWKGEQLRQYGGDTLLGEIARQLGWSQAEHHAHIKVNVDLQGRHPAPRRGGTGRQFGAAVDVAIR